MKMSAKILVPVHIFSKEGLDSSMPADERSHTGVT